MKMKNEKKVEAENQFQVIFALLLTLPFFIPRRAVVACPPSAPLLHLLLSLRVHRTNADYALSDSNRTERGSLPYRNYSLCFFEAINCLLYVFD